MLFGEIFNVALGAIRANKLRSLLTMLGIVIGVGAVITMVALGSGAQQDVQERIQALGTNLLSVSAGQSMHRGVASADRVSLTIDDATALAADARGLTAVVPENRRSQQIEYVNNNINVNVNGDTANGRLTAKQIADAIVKENDRVNRATKASFPAVRNSVCSNMTSLTTRWCMSS